MTISIDCNTELFIAKGTRTVDPQWHEFYRPYVKLDEQELPAVKKDQSLNVDKVVKHDKETQPPKRYTPASIIKELEKKGLGTKATRSEIIDTLFKRGYVDGRSIQVTELGLRTVNTLEKYAPKIVDEVLTKHFEEEMEQIRSEKREPQQVLDEAKKSLKKIIEDFKVNEAQIGEELAKANKETRDELSLVGQCPKCKKGNLHVRRGRYGTFIACNKYPDCKTTFSLPKTGQMRPTKKECEVCSYPLIQIIKKGKRPQEICLNQDCSSKQTEESTPKKELEKKQGTPCPTCEKGKLVVRNSLYGSFLGCDQYPKCKHAEK